MVSAAFLPLLLIVAGCAERPTTIDPPPNRPYANVVLSVAAANPEDRELLRQLSRTWSLRTGAQVRVVEQPWDGTLDIGMIPPADLPRWAEAGCLAEVPTEFKSQTHAYRWDDLLPVYSVRLTNWRDRTCALPIIGEGMVLVYRKDAFDGKGGRPVLAPGTWEELIEAAKSFGPNSLPPLPATAERLGAEFFSAAASYDRSAVGRIAGGELIRDDFFTFQFDVSTGEPCLNRSSFRHAAALLQQLQPFRSNAVDAAGAFRSGDAKVGILSLRELAQVGDPFVDKLGVAVLPGAAKIFDRDDGVARPTDQNVVNRIPYVGWGGRIGVVSAKCAAPAAAWDFLMEAGLPDRMAIELIAAATWGAGPYRVSQLDGRARPRWFGHGLAAAETDRLTAALHENLSPSVQNYRLRLRTPNQRELEAALDEELRKVVRGSAPADLSAANRRWQEIINRMPAAEWRAVARKSLGLQ